MKGVKDRTFVCVVHVWCHRPFEPVLKGWNRNQGSLVSRGRRQRKGSIH